jgi:hypothetical protein
MRKKIPENEKRKKVSFTIDPIVYEMWMKYCEENEIENYSQYIEKIINEKMINEKMKKD